MWSLSWSTLTGYSARSVSYFAFPTAKKTARRLSLEDRKAAPSSDYSWFLVREDSVFTDSGSVGQRAFSNADCRSMTMILTLFLTTFEWDSLQTKSPSSYRDIEIASHQFLHCSGPDTSLGTFELQQPQPLAT